MKYNLDKITERRETDSFKWDMNEEYYCNKDVIPMWVADMDFMCAKPIIDAMKERINHGIFGYTSRGEEYYDAVMNWLKNRHDWQVNKEDLVFCPPGVIMAINILIQTLTKPGDKIIVQTPIYGPLFESVINNDRKIVNNSLKIKNRKYFMDFNDLESKIDKDVKMLILCSPHNPVGRVWSKDELVRLGKICLENNIFVISDEIHFDLIYDGYKHIPFSSISEDFARNSAVCFSGNKTFNLGGLQLATLVIKDEGIRDKFNKAISTYQIRLDNVFGHIALVAGYNGGREWIEQVMEYVESNFRFVKDYLTKYIPKVQYIEPEGSYMIWLDFTALEMSALELRSFLVNKANVALSDGYEFGEEGKGFMRMNIACPRSIVQLALNNIREAIEKL